MTFEVISHKGAGPARFGMRPTEVKTAINLPFDSFKRDENQAHPCDSFNDDLFAYYDADGKAEAFEFFQPTRVTWNGKELFGMSFGELVEQVRNLDPTIVVDSSGFTSFALGIGASAPDPEEQSAEPAESIIAFTRGYYD